MTKSLKGIPYMRKLITRNDGKDLYYLTDMAFKTKKQADNMAKKYRARPNTKQKIIVVKSPEGNFWGVYAEYA